MLVNNNWKNTKTLSLQRCTFFYLIELRLNPYVLWKKSVTVFAQSFFFSFQDRTAKMLESYVTPLLMSYVNKYIKNLKPSDLQLSLWGGDVVLSKLDLKLDVLEQVKYFKLFFAVLTLIEALFWISTCLGGVLHVRLQGKIRLLKQRELVPEWTKERSSATSVKASVMLSWQRPALTI